MAEADPTPFRTRAAMTDTRITEAWTIRQAALAEMEARGAFFDSEDHSPVATFAFDHAEAVIDKIPACTAEGVKAKLWVALAHMHDGADDRTRSENAIIRRASAADVEKFAHDFDFDMSLVWSAIQSLAAMKED